MPETPEQEEKRKLSELEGKNIAHYSVLLSAWINAKMESDKSLMTLSSAGIGLLITILSTVGIKNHLDIYLFGGAFVGFLIAIFSLLKIYGLNSTYIENNIRGKSSDHLGLKQHDKITRWGFSVGFIFSILIGISSAVGSISQLEERKMAENNNTSTSKKSLDGLSELAPENTEQSTQTNTSSESSQDNSSSQSSNSGEDKK